MVYCSWIYAWGRNCMFHSRWARLKSMMSVSRVERNFSLEQVWSIYQQCVSGVSGRIGRSSTSWFPINMCQWWVKENISDSYLLDLQLSTCGSPDLVCLLHECIQPVILHDFWYSVYSYALSATSEYTGAITHGLLQPQMIIELISRAWTLYESFKEYDRRWEQDWQAGWSPTGRWSSHIPCWWKH